MASPCCPTDVKPAINNYKAVGKTVAIDDGLEVYVTGEFVGNTETGTGIIVATDVFGATPNACQFSDALAQASGYVVCMPSFIKDPWDANNVPPNKEGKFPAGVGPDDGMDVFLNWILNSQDLRIDRADQIQVVKAYLTKEYGVAKFGAVGMCWGAKVVFSAADKGLVDAVAACHGSFLTKEDAEKCDVPMCLLNSKDEPESYTQKIKPVMESKSFKDKNVFKDYPNAHHGWMGTRGIGADTDFSQQDQVEMFAQGISDLTNFFMNAMK